MVLINKPKREPTFEEWIKEIGNDFSDKSQPGGSGESTGNEDDPSLTKGSPPKSAKTDGICRFAIQP